MGRSTREEWAARVARWKDSGLTAAEYASELGISARSLAWWKWRLGSKTPSDSPGRALTRRAPEARARATAGAATPPISPLTFVEIAVPDHLPSCALPRRNWYRAVALSPLACRAFHFRRRRADRGSPWASRWTADGLLEGGRQGMRDRQGVRRARRMPDRGRRRLCPVARGPRDGRARTAAGCGG
jgi:hypothetical protein